MNEDFAPFELAVKLKEKGFRERVKGYYKESKVLSVCNTPMNSNALDNEFSTPTISQVLKWLRKKKIVISILPTGYNKETGLPNYYYVIYDVAEYFWKKYEYPQSFETWEECAIDSIKYVLDNLI